MRIRKQVDELTPEDFTEHPIWEFALDEETVEGQDEATVRPYSASGPLDESDGMFVVRARFELADGTVLDGYLTPAVEGLDGLETYQPTIVTQNGQVPLWFGLFPPGPDERHRLYGMLAKNTTAVFPLKFSSSVDLRRGPVTATVSGFLFFEDRRRGFFRRRERVVSSVI